MKTKYINGTRTPEVIAKELTKVGKLEGTVYNEGSGLTYNYYTTPQFGDDTPAIEVTYFKGAAISTRKLPKESLSYLIPNRAKEDRIPSSSDFTFGGF